MKKILIGLVAVVLFFGFASSEELPKPTYDNQLVFSITHSFLSESTAEIDYIKSQFGDGMYAPLCFSSFFGVPMEWNVNPGSASTGIQSFKNTVDSIISFARTHEVGVHLTLDYGIARFVYLYDDAKVEDVRNAQWYNDNNFSAADQTSRVGVSGDSGEAFVGFNHVDGPFGLHAPENYVEIEAAESYVNTYVFSTMSRYARKLRKHLEAKVDAAFDYLTQVQNANPDVLIIISAPGEAELNYHRLQGAKYLQDYFCDYSPFAVLEFRDWIKHEGLYASGQKYAGQGYSSGGSRYQGASGLSNFNSDFGTSFTSWNLKYYNWSLSDAVDSNYTDGSDPDPNKLPIAQYSQGGQMPSSGSHYVAGGFDPPRTMSEEGDNSFYDLWNKFRIALVTNYVKDMSAIARSSGFTKSRYFTHQIPGDYLFGTRPEDHPTIKRNPRWYASASPLVTANAYSDIGMGVTIYDVKTGTNIYRTSKYAIDACSALSSNWAALEYNPEVTGTSNISSVSVLYEQMTRLHAGSPHIISFFKWQSDPYVYDGTKRETALKQYFDAIKDSGRQAIGSMYTGKEVLDLSGSFNSGTNKIDLSWSDLIWSDMSHVWSDWGHFKVFGVYRDTSPDFTPASGNRIATTTSTSYSDGGFPGNTTSYYKVAVINDNDVIGTASSVAVYGSANAPTDPILSVSKSSLSYSYVLGGGNPASQTFTISNTGAGTMSWTVSDSASWLSVSPASGTNSGTVTVSVNPSGLSAGTYTGTVTVTASGAAGSPATVSVTLVVNASSTLSVSRDSFNFAYGIGGATPPTQQFLISNSVSGAYDWTVTPSASWLSCTPSSGSDGDAYVTLSVSPSGLTAGTYTSTVTVAAGVASNSPLTVNVALTVKPGAQDQPPFGQYEIPVDGANVYSSIPVSGWCLDDIGVESVKIYRDAVSGESGGRVYIGDAVFVEGARTDVEAAYPDYPFNYKAGWGYQLLTNFLPNGGNGTYVIHAVARDTSGNETTLDTRTIYCNNKDAVKPFGAIDTPGQGGTASGGSYINWGWVLTPQPNIMPTDGSTITVYINSVAIGHPTYNRYRSDIATLFPGYRNTDGAIGYYILDTTGYSNGVHNIYWFAVDSAGNKDGIGSRFFNITNTGSRGAVDRVDVDSVYDSASASFARNGVPGLSKGFFMEGSRIKALPVDRESGVQVVKDGNFNVPPTLVRPDADGRVRINVKNNQLFQMQLVETSPQADKTLKRSYNGYLVVGDERRPLPVGSTLDAETGTFYWIPAPGFLGEYNLEFISSDGVANDVKRRLVTITVGSKLSIVKK